MTSHDPITAIADQLAAHAGQLTRLEARQDEHHAAVSGGLAELTDQAAALGRVVAEHAAALTHLAVTSQTDPDPGGYCPGPAPAWWKLAAADRPEPVARLRAWVEQVYRPGYGHLAAGLGACWPATTCACTGWTSQPSCGRCCTCSPPAPRPWSPPRPNTRPASCPPWPTSSAPRPTAAATPATPRRPAASPGAPHERHAARPGPGLCRPRLARVPLPGRAEDPRYRPRPPGRHHRPRGRSPPGSTGTRTGTWPSPPAPPDPTSWTSTTTAPPGTGTPRSPGCPRSACWTARPDYVRTPSGGLHAYFTGSAPAQRPPARPSPGLPVPRRLRPGPALPRRRQAV